MKQFSVMFLTALGLAALPAFADPVVPWSDDFEPPRYTNGQALIVGTNGWYGSSNDIIVQTNSRYSGLQAAQIPFDRILSNRCSAAVPTNLWMQMDARLVGYDDDTIMAVDTNATVTLYVDSNGWFVVHDGPPTPTNWVVVSNMVGGGAAPRIYDTNWTHVHIYQNYTNRTWSLFMGYNLLKQNIGFVNTNISALSGFDITTYGGGNTTFLDNVSLSATNPSDLQAQGTNWLPYLLVSTNNLSRTILNGTNAASQSFEIWKTNGTISLAFSNTVNTNWLSVNPTNGTTAGEHQTINVNYSTASLAPNPTPYTATIIVAGNDSTYGFNAFNSPQTVTVSVLVQAVPELQVNPLVLTNEVAYSQRASPQTVRVWNGSVPPRTPLTFSVTNNTPTWITVSPTSGSCVDNTNTLTFTYAGTETLAPGWHTGLVTVATTSSNQPVNINLLVYAPPVIGVNVLGLTNSTPSGQNAISQVFTIRNASVGEPRGTLRYNLSDSMTWATLSPVQGTSTGESDTITVTYATDTLPAGVHTGVITAAGMDDVTGNAVASVGISVMMTVEGLAMLKTSTDLLTNSVLENHTATNTFQLWNGSMTPQGQMAYILSENISWLSVTPASGTVSSNTQTISVIYAGGTLATGAYSGTITIDAIDALTGTRASGAPKTIAVTLIVAARTPVNFERPEVRGILHVGQTLNAWRGLWQNDNRLAFAYQWQMAGDKNGNGLTDITNADGVLITTTNYVVTPAARAKYLRIKVTATDPTPWPLSTTAYSDFADAKRINATPEDFSGDGQTDLWLFDPATGLWRVAFTTTTNEEATAVFGGPDCEAEPGDFDGDGKVDPAIYAEATGLWTVMLSASGYATASVRFGGPGYGPVPADYDGDGKMDPATYEQTTGLWTALLSGNSYLPASANFGGNGYQAVQGDYDGDGKTDPAIYQASSGLWLIMLSDSGYALSELDFGGPDYTPVPGDYDGDGKTDIGVYWVAGNRWWLRSSQTGAVRQESFGTSNGSGIPVSGYYDYDAQCDPATIHVSGNFILWSIQRSNTNLGYRGQSFQIDTSRWRVSW